ncbi:MAG: DUF427 domain-containing protein [Acidimicrobiales bacterium]|nr:DUF427 domain-containing protein [Acidimicrobiales bacterium]
MTTGESAWDRFPGYEITIEPWRGSARVHHGELILAESDAAIVVHESDHQDQLYLPVADVRWEHLTASLHHTVCPFKGEAAYWSLPLGDDVLPDVAWAYPDPLPETAGLRDHVAFYTDRVEVELIEPWSGDSTDAVTYRFPTWGDVTDLVRLIDVVDVDDDGARHTSPPYPDPPLGTFLEIPPDRRSRQVVEGGHLLA